MSEEGGEDVEFNVYKEAREISKLTSDEVDFIRKQLGNVQVIGKDPIKPIFNWYQCGLPTKTYELLEKLNFQKPFPVQCQALPVLLSGRDAIIIAETGSGKTIAYALPLLKHILAQRKI